ncbi:hypothetical protein CALVIDRAFT_320407 [Calocera viscosa TUFC12733]|uniref:Uncharacterized protein n=1 Tax=Calocera viscosa (strain TUFC12733) TaxID=1330018 RepID=A0A167QLG7_CALVF|nr:hypothetical protein CALVIDRAFT_320407 [Calocera viscosa TUFC12733]
MEDQPVYGPDKALLQLTQSLVSLVTSATYADFVDEVLATIRAPMEQSTEDVCIGIYEGTLQPDLLKRKKELLRSLQGLIGFDNAVKIVLRSLTKTSVFPGRRHTEADEGDEPLDGSVASHICNIVQSRYDTSLALIALLSFVAAEAPESMKDATGLLGDTLVVVHSLSTLWHICQQPGDKPPKKEESAGLEEDFEIRFGKLQVVTEAGSSSPRQGTDYSLIDSLLPEAQDDADIRTSAFDFIDSTGLLKRRREITALAGDAKFLNELRLKGHLSVVAEVASWYPKSPAVSFVLGRALLDLKRGEEAADLLEGIASVFEEDSAASLSDRQALLAVFPIPEFQATRSFVYQQIASWLEQGSFLQLAVPYWKLAIDTALSKTDLAHLWYKISAAQIELGLFEDAYTTLMETPYRDQQDSTLRKLIDVMCSSGEGDKLVRMSFAGLQSTVEDILDFKARHQDPLQPPDYSSILYSWHVQRGNYRSAGAAMYHHGRRLGALSNAKLDYQSVTVNQAQAYLAAINCLSLVEPRNAWVVSTKADRDPSESSSVTHHIPARLFAPGTQERELTRIEDIRREYALSLARLELLPYLQELGTTGVSLSPEDAVAAFAQFGLYDSAFRAAASLQIDMSGLFKDLARKCASIPSYSGVDTMDVAPWLESASERVGYWDGTVAEKAWRYLRESLDRYDLPGTGYRYRKDVLAAILNYNRHNRIPNWLSKLFEEHNPEHLIRMFLRYGLVQDAANYTITMIRKSNAKLALMPAVTETWLPYSLIQSVIDFAQKSDEGSAKVLAKNVETLMTERLREMDNRSRLIAQKLR